MAREAERTGLNSDEDVMAIVHELDVLGAPLAVTLMTFISKCAKKLSKTIC